MKQLNWLAFARIGRYKEMTRPKANGKVRILHAPTSKLKTVQRWITRDILLKKRPHPYATAYYPGSSISNGAAPHVGRKIVVRLDLKDFFPSIGFSRVRQVFTQFGYPYKVASILANLCCYEGRLVQGAPTSPALSNLVAMRLDQRITGLKKKLKVEDKKFYYSRYADDLIFSFDDEELLKTLPLIRQIIVEEGFAVNEDKLRIMRSGRRQKVTGVVVNTKLNVPAYERRRLRAVIHNIKSHGWEHEQARWTRETGAEVKSREHFTQIIRGRIAFVRSVDPEKGNMLLDRFTALLET